MKKNLLKLFKNYGEMSEVKSITEPMKRRQHNN